MGIRRAIGFCKDIGNTYAFQHCTHSTAGNDSRTLGSRFNENFSTTITSQLLVRNCSLQNRDSYQILLGTFYTFGYSSGHFAGFTQAPTDNAIAITNDNNCRKGKRTTTFRNFSHTVDSNQAVFQIYITRSLYSVVSHNELKFKSSIAGCISNLFYSTMIQITITVENNSSNTGFQRLLCYQSTNFRCLLLLGALSLKRKRRCGNQCLTGNIIYDLDIDLFVTSKDCQTRTCGCSRYPIANPVFDLNSTFYFLRSHKTSFL